MQTGRRTRHDPHDDGPAAAGPGLPASAPITEGDHGADHHHLAVGEVDELDDAVDHRVAERHHGIDAAQREAVDDLLEQYVHGFRDTGQLLLNVLAGGRHKKGEAACERLPRSLQPAYFFAAGGAGTPAPMKTAPRGRCRFRAGCGGRTAAPGAVRCPYFFSPVPRPCRRFRRGPPQRQARQRVRPRRRPAPHPPRSPPVDRLAGLDDGERLDLAFLQGEDRHLGVLAVTLGVELDVARRTVELIFASSGRYLAGSTEPAFCMAAISRFARIVGERRVDDRIDLELGLVGIEELLARRHRGDAGLRADQALGGGPASSCILSVQAPSPNAKTALMPSSRPCFSSGPALASMPP
jgi:hypothetical protein